MGALMDLPLSFSSVQHYRDSFDVALSQYIQLLLLQEAKLFWKTARAMFSTGDRAQLCPHGAARIVVTRKSGPNQGRLFLSCPTRSCNAFQWVQEKKSSTDCVPPTAVLGPITLPDVLTSDQQQQLSTCAVHCVGPCAILMSNKSHTRTLFLRLPTDRPRFE
jgi:GRF zinc finger